MRKRSNVPFIKMDGHEIIRYTSDSVQGMFAGETYVEEDIKTTVL